MSPQRNVMRSFRLPHELDVAVRDVAHIDGVTMSDLIVEALQAHIRERRAAPGFGARLRDRIAADQQILDRLKRGGEWP